MSFPIFDANGNRISLTWDTTFILNQGDASSIYEIDGFSVRDVFSGQVEPYSDRNGFEAYRVHHNSKIIRISGMVRAANPKAAVDSFATLAGRFDPNRLYRQNLSTNGFKNLTWVDGSDTHYYQARPLASPDLAHNIYQGANVPFFIDLLALPFHGVNSVNTSVASGGVINNGGDTIGEAFTISFTLSGAGPSAWTITNSRDSVGSIVLNLSTFSSGTVVVDVLNRSVTHNGSPIDDKLTTANWWGLWDGNNTITMGPTITSASFNRYAKYLSK